MVIAMSQPEVVAQQALRRRMFAGHPYCDAAADADRVEAGQGGRAQGTSTRALLSPTGAHLVLVGDFPGAAGSWDLVEEALAGWLERRRDQDTQLASAGRTAARTARTRQPERAACRATCVWAAADRRCQTRSWPAASLAGSVLAGMFSSRITANLRERNGYSYSPRSRYRHVRAGSSFVLAADVASAVTGASLVEILYELGRLATTGITEDELELARRHAVGIFSFETATLPGLASTLAGLSANGVGLDYLANYPKAVIATTKDQVDEAARRYLAPASPRLSVVVGDPDVVAGQLSGIDEVVVRAPERRTGRQAEASRSRRTKSACTARSSPGL